jgi:hypothetical protein
MFEDPRSTGAPRALTTAELEGFLVRMSGAEVGSDDAERIDRIALLERIKHAAAAAQAREAVEFDASQRAEQEARGMARALVGRGIAEQVALARRESAHQGSRLLGMAKALVHEMPHTLAALTVGECSEWRATVMVRETACLGVEDRAAVDAEVGPRLATLGDRQVEREARALGQRLDAAGAVARARRVAADRNVTIRPAPDTMTYVSAHLPVVDGVALYAALDAEAKRLTAGGDGRGRGQLMADTLVERVTGRALAQGHPVEIGLVMSDRALLTDADDPARVWAPGVAPQTVPAALARLLVAGSSGGSGPRADDAGGAVMVDAVGAGTGGAADPGGAGDDVTRRRARVWVRRLYATPDGRDLVAMDSRRREFDGLLRRMLVLRDQTCRTPYCDAPIRHADHVRPHRVGAPTSLGNAAGLCERCNHAKEAPGWAVRPVGAVEAAGRTAHESEIATPTRHVYRSCAPPLLPGSLPARGDPAMGGGLAGRSVQATSRTGQATSRTDQTEGARATVRRECGLPPTRYLRWPERLAQDG